MMYDHDSFRIPWGAFLGPSLVFFVVVVILCSSPNSSLVENQSVLEKPASIAVENSE